MSFHACRRKKETLIASCYWAACLILLGWCECLNNVKQSSDLWSGCVFPGDTLMPFSGPEWVTICIFLLLIRSCISFWFRMSLAAQLTSLKSSLPVRHWILLDCFFLEAKAANVSIELIPFKIVIVFLSHKNQVAVRLSCSWPHSLW